MPAYDYLCAACGPFTAQRPMRDYARPQPCESCGSLSPRALLTAPHFASVDAGLRRAAAINERSANEPRRSAPHPSGCGCCKAPTRRVADAAPARPWMLGH